MSVEKVWGEKVNRKIISLLWSLFFFFSVNLSIAFCSTAKRGGGNLSESNIF